MMQGPSTRWRILFFIEIPICLGTAVYWLLTPGHFVGTTWGIDADAAHVGLSRQLAFVLLSILVWFYARMLLDPRTSLRTFRLFQEGLLLGDVLIILGAVVGASRGEMRSVMALAQAVPAALWGIVRVVFLVRTRPGRRE